MKCQSPGCHSVTQSHRQYINQPSKQWTASRNIWSLVPKTNLLQTTAYRSKSNTHNQWQTNSHLSQYDAFHFLLWKMWILDQFFKTFWSQTLVCTVAGKQKSEHIPEAQQWNSPNITSHNSSANMNQHWFTWSHTNQRSLHKISETADICTHANMQLESADRSKCLPNIHISQKCLTRNCIHSVSFRQCTEIYCSAYLRTIQQLLLSRLDKSSYGHMSKTVQYILSPTTC